MTDNPFYTQPGRDGRRTSDPLRDRGNSPALSPDWQLVRVVTADDDATSKANKGNGVNFGRFIKGHFQVIPVVSTDLSGTPTAGTSNPVCTLLVWSPILGKFIGKSPEVKTTALGAGVPFDVSLDSDGQIIMPSITGVTEGEAVAVYACGSTVDDTLVTG